MRFYYSPSTQGFYADGVHKGAIPGDAVEISREQHVALLSGLASGQRIEIAAGAAVLVDVEPDLAAPERAWRDGELAAVTWLRDRHRDELDMGRPNTLSAEQFSELLTYMQALRDWPVSEFFPDAARRPQPPGWLATQSQ